MATTTESELIQAVKSGDLKRVEDCLAAEADIHQQDDHGWLPLSWAAGRGDTAMVRLLLRHGAEPQRTGRDNRTPVMIARAASRHEAAEILEEAEKERGVWRDPTRTHPYCRAYYRRQLVAFEGFPADEDESDADAVVYLHHDLSVTESMWHGEDVVYDAVDAAWERFCRQELGFSVPAELS